LKLKRHNKSLWSHKSWYEICFEKSDLFLKTNFPLFSSFLRCGNDLWHIKRNLSRSKLWKYFVTNPCTKLQIVRSFSISFQARKPCSMLIGFEKVILQFEMFFAIFQHHVSCMRLNLIIQVYLITKSKWITKQKSSLEEWLVMKEMSKTYSYSFQTEV